MTIFNIGDTAYHAYAGQKQVWVACPECLGSGRLRVIMGDDTEVSIACVCCERGYEGSPGRISTYVFVADTQEVKITGVESNMTDDGLKIDYRFLGGYFDAGQNLFSTRHEAAARALALAREHEAEEIKRLGYKRNKSKSWASNVAYWRGQIRSAKETIERANARLNVAPKNVKEADKGKTVEEI